MGARRPLVALVALIFTAAAWLLMMLTLLGGAQNKTPLDRTWFLQADTSRIPGAQLVSRWTFWGICGVVDGKNVCNGTSPGFPLDPPSNRNFGTTEGVPSQYIGTNKYFFITRFMFAFMLIGLFWIFVAMTTGLLAFCTSIGGWLSSFFTSLGLIFQIITTTLMTVGYVKGRNNFSSNGQPAKVGSKAFAWMWTAVTLLFLASLLYCVAGVHSSARRSAGASVAGTAAPKQHHHGSFPRTGSTKRSSSDATADKEYA
ncbi:hypothetical protein GX48_05452 [Paracoccidioides brasiliensis]|nr:hypothetical protein GX48_05452 [Paracoccidioides brasiliensis]